MSANQCEVIYVTPSLVGPAEKNAEIIHERLFSVVLKCSPTSLLEVGSGRGTLGAKFSARGIRYVGLEPVEAELEDARRRYPDVRFLHASCYDDAANLNLGKFDLVYSNDVIEHLYKPRQLAAFSKAHLNPGGVIVCGTPHYGSYLRNLLLSVTNRWEHHHNPLWDGGHIKFFSKSSLRSLWEEAGFGDFTWGEIASSRLPIMPMYLYCIAHLDA
jgi:SAM-dependent methyltransferase